MCQVPHICDFSLPGAACPIPGKHRWIPDGKVLPNRPALHLARIPSAAAHTLGRLPAPCLRCCQAARQLMSPSAHLPEPRGPADINFSSTPSTPGLFMASDAARRRRGERGGGLRRRRVAREPARPYGGKPAFVLALGFEIWISCWINQRINFLKVSQRA